MKNLRVLNIIAIFPLGLGLAFAPLQAARADIGPKPSMHFGFVYEITPAPTIVSGIQFECHAADCADAEPLGEIGPQEFSCWQDGCSSLAYGYSEYHYLSIEFSDGKARQSNVFGKKYFEAYYRVTVRDNDLFVEEQAGQARPPNIFEVMLGLGVFCIFLPIETAVLVILILLAVRRPEIRKSPVLYILGWIASLVAILPLFLYSDYIKGILVTLAVELALALAYVLWRKRSIVTLLTITLMMNLFTWIPFRFVVGNLSLSRNMTGPIVGEVIIWLVEAGILALALRKQAKFWEALLLSLALNLASFGVGLLLPF